MTTTPHRNYYQVLGITRAADAAVLKEAYHRLVQHYHPDLHPDREDAEARLKEINAAYAVLSDPDQRQAYDTRTYPSVPTVDSPREQTPAGPAGGNGFHVAVEIRLQGIHVSGGDRPVRVALRQLLHTFGLE